MRGLRALGAVRFLRREDPAVDSPQQEDDAEKPGDRRGAHNFVDVFLVLVRLWQLGSHLFIYISFVGLYSYISRNRLGESARLKGIVQLVRMFKCPSTHLHSLSMI
jgi:hypothetical protein